MNVILLRTGHHQPLCRKLTFINSSAFVGLFNKFCVSN